MIFLDTLSHFFIGLAPGRKLLAARLLFDGVLAGLDGDQSLSFNSKSLVDIIAFNLCMSSVPFLFEREEVGAGGRECVWVKEAWREK